MNRVGSLCWCELKGVRIVEEIRQSNENKQTIITHYNKMFHTRAHALAAYRIGHNFRGLHTHLNFANPSTIREN